MANQNVEELVEKLKGVGVVRRGSFELKSGKKSDVYFDMKRAWGYPNILEMVGEAMWEMMDERTDCVAVGGYGGIPLGAAISTKYGVSMTMVRDSEKEYGAEEVISGFVPDTRNRVAVIDDVITTGSSVGDMLKSLEKTGCDIVGVYVVLDRSEIDINYPLHQLLSIEDFNNQYIITGKLES